MAAAMPEPLVRVAAYNLGASRAENFTATPAKRAAFDEKVMVLLYCCSKIATPEKMKPRVRNCHTCQPSCFDQPFSGSEWHPNAEVVLSFLIGMCLGGFAIFTHVEKRNF